MENRELKNGVFRIALAIICEPSFFPMYHWALPSKSISNRGNTEPMTEVGRKILFERIVADFLALGLEMFCKSQGYRRFPRPRLSL